MVEFKTIDKIWNYDIMISDSLADYLKDEVDSDIQYSGDLDEIVTDKFVVLNCTPSKKFEAEYSLKDLCCLFMGGTIKVVSDGKQVTATLKSARAVAHSCSVNRILINFQRSAGINGFSNCWVDTEDTIDFDTLNNDKFICVNPLLSSSFPYANNLMNGIMINSQSIVAVIPMNYYDYMELVEKSKKS